MVKKKRDITKVIEAALFPEIGALEEGPPLVIDMNKVIDLVNHITSDPFAVSALLLKYQSMFKILEASLQKSVEDLYNIRREFADDHIDLFSSNDPKNPYFNKKRLTDQTIKSAVGALPVFKEVTRHLVRHQGELMKIRAIRESLDSTMFMVRTLIAKSQVTFSGEIIDTEEATAQLKELEELIEEISPEEFTRYYRQRYASEDPEHDF